MMKKLKQISKAMIDNMIPYPLTNSKYKDIPMPACDNSLLGTPSGYCRDLKYLSS